MRAAGIAGRGATVGLIDLGEPRPLADDEALIDVRAAGVGNWDDIVRTGSWDVGGGVPLVLGVEAAGTITALGRDADGWQVGDEVLTHPVPLRWQGTWAERLIAPVNLVARRPANVTWEQAGAFPVPALTAVQSIEDALAVGADDTVLVHGGGTVTGAVAIGLAARLGAHVIATAGPRSTAEAQARGAEHVVDHHDPDWPDRVRALTGGRGVAAALNAGRDDEARTLETVADGGRFATITGAAPADQRGITVTDVYVRADGEQLRRVTDHLAAGHVAVTVGLTFGLDEAAAALSAAAAGGNGGAVVLVP